MTGFDQMSLVFTAAMGAVVSSAGLFPRNGAFRRSVPPLLGFIGFAAGCCLLGYIVALNDVRSAIGLSAQLATLDVPFVYFMGGATAGFLGGSYLLGRLLPEESIAEVPDDERRTDAAADHEGEREVPPARPRRQRSKVTKAVAKIERKDHGGASNDELGPGGK